MTGSLHSPATAHRARRIVASKIGLLISMLVMMLAGSLVACGGTSQRGAEGDAVDTIPPLADSIDVTSADSTPRLPRALVGTVWEATSYNNGRGGVATLVAGSRITAEFTGSGRVTGSSGCNSYRAGFATQADTLNFTPPESTEMWCETPAGVMAQESAFLAALQTVSTFHIENDVMEWRTRSGAPAARFKAAQ